jgi:hypothetical protein
MIEQNTLTQFSELSIQLTKTIPKEVKKAQGIYFTPSSIKSKLVNKSLSFISNINDISILEPSCGTCEIVNMIDDILTNVSITCVEVNLDIYQKIQNLPFKNNVEIIHGDFIKIEDAKTYDFIIGNPPYFVCKSEIVPNKYKPFISGRPNMFGLFILHSLTKLKVDGILAFVVPKSFLNSAYYANIRNYIKQSCTILDITDYENNNDFLDTEQSTFGLIVKKLAQEIDEVDLDDCGFSIRINGNYIFTSNAEQLKVYFANSTTIANLGLAVKTGSIVWNEKKDLLTNNDMNTILLYNSNVTNENKIQLTTFKNGEKGQYINVEGSTDPVIVVNRGNGNASYNFKYALIEKMMPYLVENHLNVIYSPHGMEKTELINIYKKIIHSFEAPRTKEFIQMFFGNNGLSKTELETILPIYL